MPTKLKGKPPPPTDKCNARAKNARTPGGLCQFRAGWGTEHVGYGRCKYHGGTHRNGRKQAAELLGVELVKVYGIPIETTATAALEGELKRTAGHVAWLEMKIANFDTDNDLITAGAGGMDEASVWIRIYQAERKHLRDIAKTCHDAGIDERRVQVAEQQGALLAQAIQGILLELDMANDPRAPAIVRKHLMSIGAGPAIESTAVEAA